MSVLYINTKNQMVINAYYKLTLPVTNNKTLRVE